MSSQKTGSDKDKLKGFARIESFHPYKTILFFGLVGSAVLFLALILSFAIKLSSTGPMENFKFPKIFFLSTVVMLFSSFSLTRTLQDFKNDEVRNLFLGLGVTLLLSFLFSALQIVGWYQLFKAGYFINSRSGVSLIYFITGLHFIHVLVGIMYLVSSANAVYSASKDMVKALVFFSDKYQQTKIELLNIYWHYVDFLWLCLFFMFLFTL